ncbi:MAG: TonB-dependent receptor plug domain-containing protein [Henriciella sp.]|nr:TonB-dependent receptor plug domain-containing protein [Henriciella sp.]MBO6695458.1 TonB-dependent receptor plug domain-containing protein [Henriciella sp.]
MKRTFLVGLAISLPLSAPAQNLDQPDEDSRTFTSSDFQQFAPRTALDMVSQIPGFSISQSDEEQRGFGQADENVLINGQRISSKSTSARDALSRIPAENVEKIEIVDGARLDIPGLSGQVANVSATSSGISGTWSVHQRYRERLEAGVRWAEVSVNGQYGNLGWALTLEAEPGRGGAAGRENIFDGSGNLTHFREERGRFLNENTSINGSLAWTPSNGHIANLNAEYSVSEPDELETSSEFLADGTLVSQSEFKFNEDEWEGEIGADYEFGLGPGRLKLIGLQRNEHSPVTLQFLRSNVDGTNITNDLFARTTDESESILRGEYSWAGKNNSDWQVSLEGAFNSLENESDFFTGTTLDATPNRTVIDPGTRVEEKRAETFITHGRQLNQKMRLQVTLGAEQSEISSDGVGGQTRTFTRPKGSASLAWDVDDNLKVNASAERMVGQLDFFDFVANIDPNNGDDNVGNADIVPDQRWRFSVEAEKDFGSWGALTAEVIYDEIEDLIDQVPIGNGEGPGNLDSASRIAFELDGTLMLDNFGWKGAQLEYQTSLQDTFLDDPLTGETRDFNASRIHFYEVNLRHDIPNTNLAWGINYENFLESPRFRRDVRINFSEPKGFVWGFVEHKDIFGMTGTAFFGNLIDTDSKVTRVFYDPDRNGQIDRVEDRIRNFGSILTLRLKGTF